MTTRRLLTASLVTFLFTSPSWASPAQRTFVSAANGSDAALCTRTAPCRNFAAAIAQTLSGGEVIVLDSGGYGSVTISSPISIEAPPGVVAAIAGLTTNAITVTGAAGDRVFLRGLTINGLGAARAIASSGVTLHVEGCAMLRIDGLSVTSGNFFLADSMVMSPAEGIVADGNSTSGVIEHVRVTGPSSTAGPVGVRISNGAKVAIRDTIVSNNLTGVSISGGQTALATIENSLVSHNATGISVNGPNGYVSSSTIVDNTQGLQIVSGGLYSRANNTLEGNGTTDLFTAVVPAQ